MITLRRSRPRQHLRILGLAALSLTLTTAVAVTTYTPTSASSPTAAPNDALGTRAPTQSPSVDLLYETPAEVVAGVTLRRGGMLGSPAPTIAESLPPAALAAYQRAEAVLDDVQPRCRLSWSLLAAVAHVESDHGRWGDSSVGKDGVSRPGVIGIALDGHGPVAKVRDTDDGRLDKDRKWDRAVGPMQIIPTTWAVVGVDGDGDSVRSPQDVDDAALAAGVYLCASASRLDTREGARRALLAYNHSREYVDLVLRLEGLYRAGRQWTPTATAALSIAPLMSTADRDVPARVARAVDKQARDKVETVAAHVEATVIPARQQDPLKSGAAGPAATTSTTTTSSSAEPTSAGPDPTPSTTPESSESPSTEPEGSPDATPSGSGEPEPSGSASTDPEPSGSASAQPASYTGVWTLCGGGYCLDDRSLDVSAFGDLAQQAPADLDGDGATGTVSEELHGLAGVTVSLTATKTADGLAVTSLASLSRAG